MSLVEPELQDMKDAEQARLEHIASQVVADNICASIKGLAKQLAQHGWRRPWMLGRAVPEARFATTRSTQPAFDLGLDRLHPAAAADVF